MNTQPTQGQVKTSRLAAWVQAGIVLVFLALVGWFVWQNTTSDTARFPFKLGLDLAGGSHLVYEADVSGIDPTEVPDLMNTLRDVIERRVNVFGVSEPVVQVEHSSFAPADSAERLVVELPGVTDVNQAVAEIGKTPLLEFKLVNPVAMEATTTGTSSVALAASTTEQFIATGLTGRYLKSAQLEFSSGRGAQMANEPVVSITFDAEGAALFKQITTEHTGENLAIFLDGQLLSAPRINEPISGGQAVISGNFTPDTARSLAQNLSLGALPVPITLISTQTIGATLGAEVLQKGVMAGMVGLAIVIAFMVIWYRAWGMVAAISLLGYVAMILALFQVIPVTITAAGLAGFILSLGMAVDANVLIFERIKEELRTGKRAHEAAAIGFSRAWGAIRDGNVTSILSAIILFWFGTSLVKGFALVFGIGVIVSMVSAVFVTRVLTRVLPDVTVDSSVASRIMYSIGFFK